MIDPDVDAAAKALYESDANRVKPLWEDLGGTTQQLYRDRVLRRVPKLDPVVIVPWKPTSDLMIDMAETPAPATLDPAPRSLSLREKLALKGKL